MGRLVLWGTTVGFGSVHEHGVVTVLRFQLGINNKFWVAQRTACIRYQCQVQSELGVWQNKDSEDGRAFW